MSTTVHSVNDDANAIGSTLSALSARLADTFRLGTYTVQDLRHIRATLAGVMTDRAALRGILDPLNVDELIAGTDAADTIRLWVWVAELRRVLGSVATQARQADEVAEALELGVDRAVHMVRSGETLQSIAAARLGDWAQWRRIADANSLPPGQPATGTILVIPARR